MSTTDFGALDTARKVVWANEIWKAGRDKSFFFSNGFIGTSQTDMNSPIQRVTDLTETDRGLECVMQLVQDMVGDGVVGDNELTNNEETLLNDAQVIRIDQLRNGARNKGEMAEQATVIRFRSQAKDKLSFWLSDKMDELMFLTLSGRDYSLYTTGKTRVNSQLPSLSFNADVTAPSSQRVIYAGGVTSEAALTASDKMTWSSVVRCNTLAGRKRLRPIRHGGREYYCLVISQEQRRDLVLDPTYQTILRTAEKPGSDHKLFKGAICTIDGTIIHTHNKVFNTTGLASGSKWGAGGLVDGAQAIMMGAQAGGIALLGNMFWREADVNDYNNRPGVGIGRKFGMLKPAYKSIYDDDTRQDFGTIALKTAAAAEI